MVAALSVFKTTQLSARNHDHGRVPKRKEHDTLAFARNSSDTSCSASNSISANGLPHHGDTPSYQTKLEVPFTDTGARQEWFTKLLATAEHIANAELVAACRDPTDDEFLEPAVSGRADPILLWRTDLWPFTPSEASRSSLPAHSCREHHRDASKLRPFYGRRTEESGRRSPGAMRQ